MHTYTKKRIYDTSFAQNQSNKPQFRQTRTRGNYLLVHLMRYGKYDQTSKKGNFQLIKTNGLGKEVSESIVCIQYFFQGA